MLVLQRKVILVNKVRVRFDLGQIGLLVSSVKSDIDFDHSIQITFATAIWDYNLI